MSAEQIVTEKFDGLATDYDKYRPRYPRVLVEQLASSLPSGERLNIVDLGAGTGIALEQLMEVMGPEHNYYAVDVSSDMLSKGREKFPNVEWRLGKAEAALCDLPKMDLVLAAQSFQWMDRPNLLAVLRERLNPNGVFGVMQNNRDFERSAFLNDYETLLEAMSPGYSRHYRSFDFHQEIATGFSVPREEVAKLNKGWVMTVPSGAFIGMSRSSTQAQRAIAAHRQAAHGQAFIDKLTELLSEYEYDGQIDIAYQTELFYHRQIL